MTGNKISKKEAGLFYKEIKKILTGDEPSWGEY